MPTQTAPLSQQQLIALLDQTMQHLRQRDLIGAESTIAKILSTYPNEPNALQMLGAVRDMQGRNKEAEQLYRRSLAIHPAQPHVQASLGYLLRMQRRYPEALVAFRQAITIKPDYAEGHFGLATTLHESGALAAAEQSYRNALGHNPAMINARIGLAGALNDLRRFDEAEKILSGVGENSNDPQLLAAAEHNLGIARANQKDHEGAIRHFDRALQHVPNHHGAEHSKASSLHFLGHEDQAVEAFRRAIVHNPLNMGAHRDLNQLLYRLKRDQEFLKSYDEAAARVPEVAQIPLAKASFLLKQNKFEDAREIFEHVHKRSPENLEALGGLAAANLNLKDFGAAIAAFEKGLALNPESSNLLNGMAAALLESRDPKKAAMMSEHALSLNPHDQSSLAGLGTAWRALGDARADELNGFEDFIKAYDLEPPEGYSDMESFNRDLNAYLDGLHPDAREYIDQSLRNGTQTLGDIFGAGHDLVERLRVRIEQAVARYISEMADDNSHPYLSRRSRGLAFSGAWSSRLRDCGFHINHIHPGGWISSAYYIALPDVVADAEARPGWIKFGEPSYDTGISEPIRRIIQPRPGRMVLFPSYMWHGTVPFHSPQNRTTIAFDVVPTDG